MPPTSKAQYAQVAYPKPASSFPTNDQQSVWRGLSDLRGSNRGWTDASGPLRRRKRRLDVPQPSRPVETPFGFPGGSGSTRSQPERAVRYPVDPSGTLYNSAEVGAAAAASQQCLRRACDRADLATVRHSMDAEVVLPGAILKTGQRPSFGANTRRRATRRPADHGFSAQARVNGPERPIRWPRQLQAVARAHDQRPAAYARPRRPGKFFRRHHQRGF